VVLVHELVSQPFEKPNLAAGGTDRQPRFACPSRLYPEKWCSADKRQGAEPAFHPSSIRL